MGKKDRVLLKIFTVIFVLFFTKLSYSKELKVASDNGSEFNKYFEEACKELEIEHYFSRVRTPKDNAEIERFNRTLEEEFLQMGNYIDDLSIFNGLLTDWLVEYNFNRPHRSLDMLTPMEFIEMKKQQNLNKKVLPMYPTHTKS